MTMPFVVTYSFEAVLKDGLSGFQNSRPYVVKASKLFGLKIHFQTFTSFHFVLYDVLSEQVYAEFVSQDHSEPRYRQTDDAVVISVDLLDERSSSALYAV